MRGSSRELGVIAAAWAIIGIAFATHNYFTYVADGNPVTLASVLWWSVAEWLPWVVLTPLILLAVRTFRPRRGALVKSALVLTVAGIAFAAAQVLLEYAFDRIAVLVSGDPSISVRVWLSHGTTAAPLDLSYLVPRKFGFSYMTYWAVVVAAIAIEYYRLFIERDVRAARLESALVSAQLEALQAQVQPHFLFNTLNAIASLIPEDPVAAEETVESLSELLRASLREGGQREIPLSREIELLELYLGIQSVRFQHKLRVVRDYDETLDRVLVPPMVLQPLVENAIRHGIARHGEGGSVTISTHAASGELVLEVRDDGPGFAAGTASAAGGIGLSNTRLRLERLYGTRASLSVGNNPSGGAFSRIRLPLVRELATHDPEGVRQPSIVDATPSALAAATEAAS